MSCSNLLWGRQRNTRKTARPVQSVAAGRGVVRGMRTAARRRNRRNSIGRRIRRDGTGVGEVPSESARITQTVSPANDATKSKFNKFHFQALMLWKFQLRQLLQSSPSQPSRRVHRLLSQLMAPAIVCRSTRPTNCELSSD